jgi:hypothetical protein
MDRESLGGGDRMRTTTPNRIGSYDSKRTNFGDGLHERHQAFGLDSIVVGQ